MSTAPAPARGDARASGGHGTEAILRAAADLAREQGDAFTMEQLERRTGLSRATLYRRVGSKRAVLERLAAKGEAPTPERQGARARILAAARRVVAARGVGGATMERVAEEAGVGVATVYRHFGGRENLLDAFVHATEGRARVHHTIEHADGDLRSDLTAVARLALALFTDNRDLMRIVIGGTPEELDVLRVLKGSSDRTLNRLASLFEREAEAGRLTRAGSPRRLALAFVGMLLAFAVIGPEHYGVRANDLDALATLAVHVFLDGAAT